LVFDYAYVILERAVPAIEDGKPVQRRIMHSPKELDDGRYNSETLLHHAIPSAR
jgi:DNA gyrase/topoisomerase IV subunit A